MLGLAHATRARLMESRRHLQTLFARR